MIFYLEGKDDFRIFQYLKKLKNKFQEIYKHKLEIREIDLGKINEITNDFFSQDFFSFKKIFIFFNLSANKNFQNKILSFWEKFLCSENVFIFYEIGQPSGKIFDILRQKANFQKFDFLKEKELILWAQKRIKDLGGEISKEALKTLIDFTKTDLWILENEIKKLVAFKNKERIEKKDVEILVAPKIEIEIFKTLDFFLEGKKEEGIKRIKWHLEKGHSPIFLFSLLAYQIRSLICLKDFLNKKISFFEIQNTFPTFLLKKFLKIARKIEIKKLKKIYQEIFQLDLKIKKGEINPSLALDLFLSQI